MARVLTVPLTADVLSGFGETTQSVLSTVRRTIRNGAIGINLEDFHHVSKKLYTVARQVDLLKSIRRLGDGMRVPIVINARTDALRYSPGDAETRMNEATVRSLAYRDAGADCVYPMGLASPKDISSFVRDLDFPVNVMIREGLPPVSELERLGVARLSFGPSASYAAFGLLRRAANEVLTKGTYGTLLGGALTFGELNSLALPHGSSDTLD